MPISNKQKQIMAFPFTNYDALICDGAIRSGKTAFMMLSFVDDAMRRYSEQRFAICGKTVDSTIKNIIMPYLALRYAKNKYVIQWKRSEKLLVVSKGNRKNTFEIFGGKDEGSFMLIQGRTLAGVLLDEVALQPRSFVEQALARCSVEGSKFWFNCNPENPSHWFYKEWIKKCDKKNCFYLHFVMEDNPSLSEEMLARYKALYSGAFYERFVLGKWVAADGLVYPFFNEKYIYEVPDSFDRFCVSCDYGTVNPTSMGLWGEHGESWYRIDEFYHDSRQKGFQMTDEEYYRSLVSLVGKRKLEFVVVDPSAASFIECIKRHGKFTVKKAENDVLAGIHKTSDALKTGKIRICKTCPDIIREFSLYRWDEGAKYDAPRKENDHAMDDMRYFTAAVTKEGSNDFFAVSLARERRF